MESQSQPATLSKKRLCPRCFPVNIAKFLRTPVLQKICERLLLLVKFNKSPARYHRNLITIKIFFDVSKSDLEFLVKGHLNLMIQGPNPKYIVCFQFLLPKSEITFRNKVSLSYFTSTGNTLNVNNIRKGALRKFFNYYA